MALNFSLATTGQLFSLSSENASQLKASRGLGKVVLIGATLSFIGLAEAGLAEWGNLVASGQDGILAGYWWTATFGGLVVFLWALSCNLLGDGLRDLFDPKTSRR